MTAPRGMTDLGGNSGGGPKSAVAPSGPVGGPAASTRTKVNVFAETERRARAPRMTTASVLSWRRSKHNKRGSERVVDGVEEEQRRGTERDELIRRKRENYEDTMRIQDNKNTLGEMGPRGEERERQRDVNLERRSDGERERNRELQHRSDGEERERNRERESESESESERERESARARTSYSRIQTNTHIHSRLVHVLHPKQRNRCPNTEIHTHKTRQTVTKTSPGSEHRNSYTKRVLL